MFWLIWVWALLYVTLAVWGQEAFAFFVTAHIKYPIVLYISCFSVLVFAGNFVRYAMRGFAARRMKAIPWLVLPAGVVLFLMGFVLMAGFGKSRLMVLQEGQEFKVPGSARSYVVERLDVDVVENYFGEGRGFGLLRSEPNITLSNGGVRHIIGAFPPTRFDGVYSHILDFGIAPGIALLERGNIALSGNPILRILPPGTEDSIEIEGLPYRFYVRLAPERIVEQAGEKIIQYDMVTPKYFVRIEKGDETVFDGTSDQEIVFDEFLLRMEPYVYWVWLEFKKGIGIPFIWAGAVLIALGLPLMLMLMAGRAIRHVHLHAGG